MPIASDGAEPLKESGPQAERDGEPLSCAVVPFDQLSPEWLARWEQLRQQSGRWNQPFFASRFSAGVHQARGDVLVAVISPAGPDGSSEPVGFLPFHRVGRVGVPVGRFLNDAQNVIGLPPEKVDWSLLMHACGVLAFDLHAIVDPAESWMCEYRLKSVGAFRADFGGDSRGYLRRLTKDHRTIGKQGQKTRKLGREVGKIRLEVDCRSPDVLSQTIQWKRAQYQRTHILDLFLPDWTRRMIDVLHGGQDIASSDRLENESLRGLLSVLWAGDQVVAAHYGMIEQGRLHYWFPTYDPVFSRYSPGTALFTELVRESTCHGIDCIDMGYGEQPYKQKQTATATRVAYGTITNSNWHRLTHSAGNALSHCVKRMPMKEKLKKAWRAIHPTAGIKKLG
ncbi:GNAT family N-acetyltransferase [Aporhodopirellula aestuarii]|uniref:GNAT family N-acetyltransferase n=1 Tax=Aporhodopirellula aestuarii TaxID=2950107 RepID=A0ABT0U809_9BACT|nr:GNAT family N-acetyltransferase [Aporhodopirellula aestuarii]MCM2373064.1 GNAT family N-acetyltransferase [Aporhodopirellula aestuarii]